MTTEYAKIRIELAMEEYKTLRAEILILAQNRTNIIIWGFAGLITLLSLSFTIFASSANLLNQPPQTQTQQPQQLPTSSKPLTSGKQLPQDSQEIIKNELERRRILSASILIIIVPFSCAYITQAWADNALHIIEIGNYIATNLEVKINLIYLPKIDGAPGVNNNNHLEPEDFVKPLTWEMYMSSTDFSEESFWLFIIPNGFITCLSVLAGFYIIFAALNPFILIGGLIPLIMYFVSVLRVMSKVKQLRETTYISHCRSFLEPCSLEIDKPNFDPKSWKRPARDSIFIKWRTVFLIKT
jgi:hypothetical protein